MSKYVDGFVVPVPKANVDAYINLSELCSKVWREYGAIDYIECMADDAPMGELTSFPRSVMMKEDETVFFSWIVYNSREHRDDVNEKVMRDPRLAAMKDAPFDTKRMIFGGFKTMVIESDWMK